eukprot:1136867-Pelagomonas_calceolata.AAC.5
MFILQAVSAQKCPEASMIASWNLIQARQTVKGNKQQSSSTHLVREKAGAAMTVLHNLQPVPKHVAFEKGVFVPQTCQQTCDLYARLANPKYIHPTYQLFGRENTLYVATTFNSSQRVPIFQCITLCNVEQLAIKLRYCAAQQYQYLLVSLQVVSSAVYTLLVPRISRYKARLYMRESRDL